MRLWSDTKNWIFKSGVLIEAFQIHAFLFGLFLLSIGMVQSCSNHYTPLLVNSSAIYSGLFRISAAGDWIINLPQGLYGDEKNKVAFWPSEGSEPTGKRYLNLQICQSICLATLQSVTRCYQNPDVYVKFDFSCFWYRNLGTSPFQFDQRIAFPAEQ